VAHLDEVRLEYDLTTLATQSGRPACPRRASPGNAGARPWEAVESQPYTVPNVTSESCICTGARRGRGLPIAVVVEHVQIHDGMWLSILQRCLAYSISQECRPTCKDR